MGYTNIGNRGESVLKESIFYKHGRNKLMITRFLLKKLDMHGRKLEKKALDWIGLIWV